MNIELLQTMFDNLPIAVFVKDHKLRYVYVNDTFVYHSGYTREKCIGFTDREFQNQAVVAELAEGFENSDNAVLQKDEVVETTFTYNVAGIKPTPFLTRKSRLITPDGASYILGTCTDVSRLTDLEAVNARVVTLNKELAQKMIELSAAQDEVIRRGKMAQLGQLTATVAHELRNPLGAVRTSAFLIEKKLKGKDLGIEPQLERINNGIVRCDSIITQLLDFARSRKLELKPVALDAWLEQLVEQESQSLPHALSIELVLGLDKLMVGMDNQRMTRAMINLLSNASEAMLGNGKEKASLEIRDPLIKITTRKTSRGIEIEVEDNGPGMSADVMARIREPLFTTKSFGTGLGVPAIEQIVEQHSGGLDIWSEEGKGARFTLWWPLATEQDAAA